MATLKIFKPDLANCLLEQQCNPKIKGSMRAKHYCNNCEKCGWNKNVDEARKREAKEKRNEQKRVLKLSDI